MGTSRWNSLFLALLISFVFLLTPPFQASALAQAEAPKEIVIGATISLSGRFTTMVGPFKKLSESWAEVVNERGGIWVGEYKKRLPVRFVIYDDKSDPTTSAKYYERLITIDKVNLLIGPFSSYISYAASTSAEKYQVPMVLAEANDKKLFERNYKWMVTNLDYAEFEGHQYLEMLKAEGKVKTIAFVSEDTLHSTGVLKGAIAKAKELGFTIALEETAPADTTDFTAIITKIKGINPDVVFLEAFPPFEVPFMKQANELGLRPKEFFNGHVTRPYLNSLGPIANNVASSVYWVPGLNYGNQREYLEVLKKTGIKWDEYMESAIHFWAYQTIEHAIEAAGTFEKNKFMETLRKLHHMTITGPVHYKENGVGTIKATPVQVIDGNLVPIWPPEAATAKHIFPTPWK